MVILCFVCMSELTQDLLHKMLNISQNITLTLFIKLENKIAYGFTTTIFNCNILVIYLQYQIRKQVL